MIHHFSTPQRRIQALDEISRVLRVGGTLFVCAWALEQAGKKYEQQDVMIPWQLQSKYVKEGKAKETEKGSDPDTAPAAAPTEGACTGAAAGAAAVAPVVYQRCAFCIFVVELDANRFCLLQVLSLIYRRGVRRISGTNPVSCAC